jgi:hypothetical protein
LSGGDFAGAGYQTPGLPFHLDVISEKVEEQDHSQMICGGAGDSKHRLRHEESRSVFMSENHKMQVCAKQSQALLRFQINQISGSSNCLLIKKDPKRSLTGNVLKEF